MKKNHRGVHERQLILHLLVQDVTLDYKYQNFSPIYSKNVASGLKLVVIGNILKRNTLSLKILYPQFDLIINYAMQCKT